MSLPSVNLVVLLPGSLALPDELAQRGEQAPQTAMWRRRTAVCFFCCRHQGGCFDGAYAFNGPRDDNKPHTRTAASHMLENEQAFRLFVRNGPTE